MPCPFEVLVRRALPLRECFVLGEEAHGEFMEQSGLFEDLPALISPGGGGEDTVSRTLLRVRHSHLSSPIGGELKRQICEALIALGAPSVAVVSEGLIRRHLKSIPGVKDAIKEAWLSVEGLRRQVEAASCGKAMPAWPIFILGESASH